MVESVEIRADGTPHTSGGSLSNSSQSIDGMACHLQLLDQCPWPMTRRLSPTGGWPGSNLDGGQAIGRGPPEDVIQGSFRERCGEESWLMTLSPYLSTVVHCSDA